MSTLDPRERSVLFRSIEEDLANVIGASGNPDELVRVTTSIVQGTKRLLIGIPDDLSNRSTSALTDLVKAARHIAKNPQAVDARAVQELSTTRRAVETVINQLDAWHSSFTPKEDVLDDFSGRGSSPDAAPLNEAEARLVRELERYKTQLASKKEPQKNPPDHRNVETTLSTALKGVLRGSEELVQPGDSRLPNKEQLLDSMTLVAKWVCVLLDVVDSLFVSKYPMRSQVHSFTTTLIDCTLAYGVKSKSDDAAAVRTFATQAPALAQAVVVMEEQCQKRCQSLVESRDFSIRRNTELEELQTGKIRNKGKPPEPPKPKKPVVQEFEISCIVCTSVAVDQKTQQPISRGAELTLVVSESTKIMDIKQDLSSRTGLPVTHIRINQGSEELPDSLLFQPNNPLPYFMFNEFEPTESELREIRKDQRRQNRLTLANLDWSKVTGPIALALYEYDTLGDESSLDFDEGDIIEIKQKSADGWWEGSIGDKSGSFPASFVEEIHSREEGLQLMKMVKTGSHQPNSKTGLSAEKKDPSTEKRYQRALSISTATSSTEPASPRLTKNPLKFKRMTSSPEIPQSADGSPTKSKKSVFLKKSKPKLSGPDDEIEEENNSALNLSPSSPKKALVQPKRSKPTRPPPPIPFARKPKVLGQEDKETERPVSPSVAVVAPGDQPKPSKLSPQMNYKRSSQSTKRPPPPLPPPFAVTHPSQASKLHAIIKASQSVENNDELRKQDVEKLSDSACTDTENSSSSKPAAVSKQSELELPSQPNKSSSMEELFKTLEEFDVKGDSSDSLNVPGSRTSKIDSDVNQYEVVEFPSPVPESASLSSQENITTIKISDFKSDSDSNDEDVDDNDETTEVHGADSLGDGVDVMHTYSSAAIPKLPPRVEALSHSSGAVSHEQAYDAEKQPRGEDSSVKLKLPSQERKVSPSPPPVAPPRVRKRGGQSPRIARRPPPPPKPKVLVNVRASHSDVSSLPTHSPFSKQPDNSVIDQQDVTLGEPRSRRWTMAAGRQCLLGSKSTPPRSRSPMVQRRTKVAIGPNSPKLQFDEHPFTQCTGLGKEGILFKEASSTPRQEWKARYFRLLEDGLIYFDSDYDHEVSKPIGELAVSKMHKALALEEIDGLQRFAVLIRYDSSVILGCHSHLEIQDWVQSINTVIDADRVKEKALNYFSSHSTAVTCIKHLLSAHTVLGKSTVMCQIDMDIIKPWLNQIDNGEVADLSYLSSTSTTICLLKEVLSPQRIAPIITNDIALDLSQQVNKSCTVEDARIKLHHLSDDSVLLMKLLLEFFSKVLASCNGEINFSDLNRMFGSAVFENLKINQSLTLIVYLTNNREEIFA